MKISKIIFFSLLGAMALLLIAFDIDLRINGKKGSISIYDDMEVYRESIPDFKILYLQTSKGITIKHGDSSYVEIYHYKDSLVPKFNYSLNNDTLIISGLNLLRKRFFFSIYTNSDLNRFYLVNSDLYLHNFLDSIHPQNLFVDLNNSTLRFNQLKKALVNSITYRGKNKSFLYADYLKVDSIDLLLHNSRVQLNDVGINKIKGDIYEKSNLYINQPRELSLKRDGSSSIRIN